MDTLGTLVLSLPRIPPLPLGTSHGGFGTSVLSLPRIQEYPLPSTQIGTSHGGLRDPEGSGVWRLIVVSL